MKYLIIVLIALLMYACNSEKKKREYLESLQKSPDAEKYELGLACMRYISLRGSDITYSKTLIRKLLSAGFFAEAIHAVEMLNEKFTQDPELFYLRGMAYRSLHQYNFAMADFDYALKIQPDNTIFSDEARSMMEEQKVWNEIQTLNESLVNATDSIRILLSRTDHLFGIGEYDAVLFDLGTVSKMGTSEDSLYFTKRVASLKQGGNKNSVEILSDMMNYYRAKMR